MTESHNTFRLLQRSTFEEMHMALLGKCDVKRTHINQIAYYIDELADEYHWEVSEFLQHAKDRDIDIGYGILV
jgi:hypothetical protein